MSKKRSSRGGGNQFWQSYSDIMAALLLVFVLVLTGSILKAQREYEIEKDKLEEARATAESMADTIEEQAALLEKILGIRQSIINALVEEFSENDMDGKLTIDEQTGAIVFDSNLLFEFGKHTLSDEGKEFLRSFLPKYTDILLSDEFSKYVAEIIIEGHTDPVGEYMYNMGLSQERALNVAEYAVGGTDVYSAAELEVVRLFITVNGRSESELIYDASGNIDPEASRRVELQFRLKDDEMIRQMLEAIS